MLHLTFAWFLSERCTPFSILNTDRCTEKNTHDTSLQKRRQRAVVLPYSYLQTGLLLVTSFCGGVGHMLRTTLVTGTRRSMIGSAAADARRLTSNVTSGFWERRVRAVLPLPAPALATQPRLDEPSFQFRSWTYWPLRSPGKMNQRRVLLSFCRRIGASSSSEIVATR